MVFQFLGYSQRVVSPFCPLKIFNDVMKQSCYDDG